MPRFDQPKLTVDGADEVDRTGATVPPQLPIPPLQEPDVMPLVVAPQPASLVLVAHPRISVLSNYQRAGWRNARHETWLRPEALKRLISVVEALPDPWGLCVFDAWRPLALQAELHQAAYGEPGLPPGFVSPPDHDPTTPPPHLTGGTVDCSFTLHGTPLGLGAGFDDFTSRSRADALENEPGHNRELRRWLFWTMSKAGFVVLDAEWWHFEYGTRRWAAITGNQPLFGPAAP